MSIYILTILLYFIIIYIGIKVLEEKNRIQVISESIGFNNYTIAAFGISSFVPIFRLLLVIAIYYFVFCKEETIKDFINLKNK